MREEWDWEEEKQLHNSYDFMMFPYITRRPPTFTGMVTPQAANLGQTTDIGENYKRTRWSLQQFE